MFRHILVPTDGSEVSSIGVDKGFDLARENGSRVTIVTVTKPLGAQFAFSGDLWWGQDKSCSKSCAKSERIELYAARRIGIGSLSDRNPSGI